MKTKYMSRKFIVAIVGLVLAIVGVLYGNYVAIVSGCFIAGCFVIGESIVDKAASTHRTVDISEYRNFNIPMQVKTENENASENKT